MKLDKAALIELAKSTGRLLYFGLLGLIGTVLTSLLTNESLTNAHITVNGVTVPVGIVILAVLTGAIKAVDRYRHVSANTASNGIAPDFLQQ